MDWNPIFFFDQEPDWKRLAGLHPDACLIGQQHRNGKLWYLDLTLDDLPPEYHHLQLSGFPCDFTVPDGLPLSPANKEFIERVGTVAQITGVLPAGVLRLGVVIATLAGVRTLVVEDPWGAEYAVQPGRRSSDLISSYPGFDTACLLDSGVIKSFGAAFLSTDIVWDKSDVCVKCDLEAIQRSGSGTLELLEALPYVRLERAPFLGEREPNHWPKRLWPREWGDFDAVLGIGPLEQPMLSGWKDCYYRPSRNTPGTIATLFEMVFKRPWATTKIGKYLRPSQDAESSDEDA